MMRIPRRLFTEEFKRQAIKHVTEQHLNFAVASQELDVASKSIRSLMQTLNVGNSKPR